MDTGRKLFRIGLLILFLLIGHGIAAQNNETEINVSITINPEILSVGNQFTLTLVVDYPVPDDVSVIMPPFAGSISLDRYVRTPRISLNGHMQTAFEFRMTANAGGRVFIGPLSVLTPDGEAEIEPVLLIIRNEAEERYTNLRLVWNNAPRQITAGERVTFTLLADITRAGNLQMPLPAFFMPEVPQGVILFSSPLSQEERQSGIVLKLTLIPLEAGQFSLPARTLMRENIRFEIPALLIRVIR